MALQGHFFATAILSYEVSAAVGSGRLPLELTVSSARTNSARPFTSVTNHKLTWQEHSEWPSIMEVRSGQLMPVSVCGDTNILVLMTITRLLEYQWAISRILWTSYNLPP